MGALALESEAGAPAVLVRSAVVATILALAAAATSGSQAADRQLEEAVRARGFDAAAIIFPGRLTDEMRAWAQQQVDGIADEEQRLETLLTALLDRNTGGITYAVHANGTAEEVFRTGRANCLAFTTLFVAMAREVGLDAYYLQVRRSPRYGQEGDLVVVWEHVTAGYGPPERRLALEFNIGPPIESAESERLTDLSALAMFYSNRGAERLLAGADDEALVWLETAVRLEPGWSQAWLNLGVARRRTGDLPGAEAAYRAAIEAEPGNDQAYHNLAGLLRLEGEEAAAREMLRLLDRRDNRDPFIYLSLGDESLQAGRLRAAERFYSRAYRLAPSEGETRAARGLLELTRGRLRRARRWLERALATPPASQGGRVRRLAARLLRAEGEIAASAIN